MRHIPNLICLFRIVLIVPLLQAMLAGDQAHILILFTIAAVSDGLDGYLAKRFGWTSQLGRFLDPAADKLLLVSVFIVAAWLDIAPWWVAAVAAARDLVIAGGALIYRLWFGPVRGRPTIISKINTGVQISYLLAVILASAIGLPPREVLDALAVVVLLTTVASGMDYVTRFVQRAFAHRRGWLHDEADPTGRATAGSHACSPASSPETTAWPWPPCSARPLAGDRCAYLQGPAGSGKSHLLQALCAAVPGSAYFPLAQLLASGPEVLEGADQLAAVALDDLHVVAGDAGWERRLFALYNDCDGAWNPAGGCRATARQRPGRRAAGPAFATGLHAAFRVAPAGRGAAARGPAIARGTAWTGAAGRNRALPAAQICARHVQHAGAAGKARRGVAAGAAPDYRAVHPPV